MVNNVQYSFIVRLRCKLAVHLKPVATLPCGIFYIWHLYDSLTQCLHSATDPLCLGGRWRPRGSKCMRSRKYVHSCRQRRLLLAITQNCSVSEGPYASHRVSQTPTNGYAPLDPAEARLSAPPPNPSSFSKPWTVHWIESTIVENVAIDVRGPVQPAVVCCD